MKATFDSTFNFDEIINRNNTASLKYDGRQGMFGNADVIPLWVADMDFATAPAITQALLKGRIILFMATVFFLKACLTR